ncbi:MAG: hypothetical protein H9533_12910 [Rhodobacteraceae bacterium]|nr:hypothetical protein [Paracoccaceae bacterium]
MPDLAFLFVVEGPRLEAQSLLLASSIRRHHPRSMILGYRPIGAEPAPAAVQSMFRAVGGLLLPLPPAQGLWRGAYPHGNKIIALAQPRDAAISIFLDTDMVMTAPLDAADLPGHGEVSVVPEGIQSWGKEEDRWERVYAHFGLSMPEERIRLLRGARRSSPPYFNAGFVAQRETDRVDGQTFGQLWLDTARKIDHEVGVANKRPWLDQIALPVTLRRFGMTYRLIDEAANFSISNGRSLPDPFAPKILHYHRARFLRDWAGSAEVIAHALDRLPPSDRTEAEALLTAAGFLGDLIEEE